MRTRSRTGARIDESRATETPFEEIPSGIEAALLELIGREDPSLAHDLAPYAAMAAEAQDADQEESFFRGGL